MSTEKIKAKSPKGKKAPKSLVPTWSIRNAALVSIAGCVLLGAGGYFAVVAPAQTQRAEAVRSLEFAKEANTLAQASLVSAQNYEKKYPTALGAYESFRKSFPSTAEIDALNSQVEALARQSGVKITSLDTTVPQTIAEPVPAPADFDSDEMGADATPADDMGGLEGGVDGGLGAVAALPRVANTSITISATGAPAALALFAQELKDMDRSLIVSTAGISQSNEGESTLRIAGFSFFYTNIDDPTVVGETPDETAGVVEGEEVQG